MTNHNHQTDSLLNTVPAINADGCAELPFVQDMSQTYFDYLNGTAGYVVFILGGALLLIAMVSRKQLSKVPAWLAGVVIAALALGALPALLPTFGVNLGCGGADIPDGITETYSEPETTPAENEDNQ